jgi:hypothetical protein
MKFWSGQRALERWDASSTELPPFIYQRLPVYKMDKDKILKMGQEEINDFDLNHMIDLLFMRTYIEDFEKANNSPIKDKSDAKNIELAVEEIAT